MTPGIVFLKHFHWPEVKQLSNPTPAQMRIHKDSGWEPASREEYRQWLHRRETMSTPDPAA